MAGSATVLAGLDFCRAVVDEHRIRIEDGKPSAIVPVVFDGFEAIAGLVAGTARAHSGSVILASDYQDGCDAGAEIEVELPQLRRAIDDLTSGIPGSLVLEIDGSFARVTSSSGAGYSDAQEVVRGLAASLFHPDLRSAELGFLVFDGGPLDDVTAHAVWSVVNALPALLSLAAAQTLVVGIADGRLDVGLHCSGVSSVRFHVRERDLLTRRSWTSCVQEVSRVGRMPLVDAPVIVLFTGAGASRHYGLPLGNDFETRRLVTSWMRVGLGVLPRLRLGSSSRS